MHGLSEKLNDRKSKDLKVLCNFISIFCRENHQTEDKTAFSYKADGWCQVTGNKELVLCQDCSGLLKHGVVKLLLCPYDPKPMCKKCKTHCYAPDYRGKMQKVMRFSGSYLIKHGRLDLIFHYLF